ncbi:MAG TPA: hypothetical protein VES88_09450 [Gemmatimonadaceae bacterium]|nr:hypothetical protein [Gemmatimonadaceae bacterium]
MFHSPPLRPIVILVQCATFLATSFPLLAQIPAVTPTQGQRPTFVPRIKEIRSPAGTYDGRPKLLPLQTFTVEGSLFNDLASQNRITVVRPSTTFSPAVQVAEIMPLSATSTKLTARIPANVEGGSYVLRVKVEGSEPSNGIFVEVADLNIGARMGTPHIISVSPDSGKRGESISLKGLFRSSPRIFLDPTSAGGESFSVAPSFTSREAISFKVPAAALPGGYRVSVASPGSDDRTNALRLRVVDDTASRYVVEIARIRSITESADGIGSDEIYAVALSFLVGSGLESPVEMGTGVFNDVDAGESIQPSNPSRVRVFHGASASDHVILIGLEEYDSSDGDGPEPKRGERVMRGMGYDISEQSRDPRLSSREKLVAFARLSMMRELASIVRAYSDDLLGIEELRLTDADIQKAAQLQGAPVVKQLVFKGDGSHYVMDVHLRMIK